MKKKLIIITIIVLVLICGVFAYFKFFKSNKETTTTESVTKSEVTKGTIDEILGISFNDISYIRVGVKEGQEAEYLVDGFVSEYGETVYKKTTGDYSDTIQTYFVFYDSSDQVLFTMVEILDENKVFLKKGKFTESDDMNQYLYEIKK